LAEYIPRLAELNVSHVTITVNAVNPKIGAEIYEWVYFNNKSLFGIDGATILLNRQTEAIKLLKQHGITVKINTVVIPRVNEFHVHEISEYVANLGADVQNCIPLIPVEGTAFGDLQTPSPASMRAVRAKASVFIKQMTHCARCRADAVGLLGEANSTETERLLINAKKKKSFKQSPYIAVSSTDGVSVNQHLGVANFLWIFGYKNNIVELIEKRPILKTGNNRWLKLANILSDCHSLLVAGVGRTPLVDLDKTGINTVSMEGSIVNALEALFNGKNVPVSALKISGRCGYGSSCSGSGSGCN
jgi:nitrogen fixation protein NifB